MKEVGSFPKITNRGLASTTVFLWESGEYFVLGDKRNNSEDSRYADIGNVKKAIYCRETYGSPALQ